MLPRPSKQIHSQVGHSQVYLFKDILIIREYFLYHLHTVMYGVCSLFGIKQKYLHWNDDNCNDNDNDTFIL